MVQDFISTDDAFGKVAEAVAEFYAACDQELRTFRSYRKAADAPEYALDFELFGRSHRLSLEFKPEHGVEFCVQHWAADAAGEMRHVREVAVPYKLELDTDRRRRVFTLEPVDVDGEKLAMLCPIGHAAGLHYLLFGTMPK